MSSNIVTKTLWIDNMTCVNCENIIEQTLLQAQGVQSVTASYSRGTATVTFDAEIITLATIIDILEQEHYTAREDNSDKMEDQQEVHGGNYGKYNQKNTTANAQSPNQTGKSKTDLLGILIIVFAFYLIARRFGLLNIFNNFPIAKDGMGYGMLFLIGVLTSVHCVAMCGGICISQCVPKKEGAFESKFAALRPSLLYNLGRVISYTVIGAIIGAVGSVISFSGAMKGSVQILAGIFMVIMGLNMLNVFPWLRRFNLRMPKVFAKKIYAQRSRNNSPLYIGLLNGLMPCGPLQAMQLYALSTGSPVKGAVSMFLFSVGTVPLLFAFGALSSFLSRKFTAKMMTVSAVLVVFLGIFMFNNGISLSGVALPTIPAFANTKQEANIAVLDGDTQTVTSGIGSGSYEPIIVQKGIPVKWTIKAQDGQINGCNNSIIIQKFNIQKNLEVGDNVIEFTPTESGTIPFSCWMGMIRSNITVVDDLSKVDSSVVADAKAATRSSSGSCCSGGNYAGSNSTGSNSGAATGGLTNNNLLDVQIPTDNIAVAKVEEDGTQTVNITYDKNGFSPAVVVIQSGLKTTWNIKSDLSGGNTDSLIFPYYNAQLTVSEGDNPINFIPDQTFDFFTSDSSYYGYVKVVDDINQVDLNEVKKEVSEYQPSSYSGTGAGAGGSCCQ